MFETITNKIWEQSGLNNWSKPIDDAVNKGINDAIESAKNQPFLQEMWNSFTRFTSLIGDLIGSGLKVVLETVMGWFKTGVDKAATLSGAPSLAYMTQLKDAVATQANLTTTQTIDPAAINEVLAGNVENARSGFARLMTQLGNKIYGSVNYVSGGRMGRDEQTAHQKMLVETDKVAKTVAREAYTSVENKTYEVLRDQMVRNVLADPRFVGTTLDDAAKAKILEKLKADPIIKGYAAAEAQAFSGVDAKGSVISGGLYQAALTWIRDHEKPGAKPAALAITAHNVSLADAQRASVGAVVQQIAQARATTAFESLPVALRDKIKQEPDQVKHLIEAISRGVITPQHISQLSRIAPEKLAEIAGQLEGVSSKPLDQQLRKPITQFDFPVGAKEFKILSSDGGLAIIKDITYSDVATTDVTIPATVGGAAAPAAAVPTR